MKEKKMKKIMIALAAAAMTAVAQAAAVQWSSSATSAYNGQTMYLLTSIATSYDSLAAFEAAAVDSKTVTKSGPTYKVALHEASGDKIVASGNFYLAVIDATDSSMIHYLDVTSTFQPAVYTPPESAKDGVNIAFATVATSATTAKIGAAVPEPTSGLLLLLGMAGLALRRRRA